MLLAGTFTKNVFHFLFIYERKCIYLCGGLNLLEAYLVFGFGYSDVYIASVELTLIWSSISSLDV